LKALQILEVVDVRGTSTRAIEELGKLSELRKISVTTNGASDKKCKAFCEAVQKLPSLRSLSISSGGFGSPWGTLEWICSASSLPPLQRILLAGPIRLIPDCVRNLTQLQGGFKSAS
jgi:disease resistance protein RPM1